MEIYGIKSCDTCRKAVKALPEARFVDLRTEGIASELRAEALARFGEALVNRRSTTWRGLSEEERAGAPEALLQAHPTLMKRPLIIRGDDMWLGWTKEVQAALNAA